MDRVEHWNRMYTERAETAVGWYQPDASTSLALLDDLGVEPGASVIDVGGGASRLVDGLLDRGFDDVTVLDMAPAALDITRARLGGRAARVEWITDDILRWRPHRRYDVWHDRGVFHFLVHPADRARYVELLETSVNDGGRVVMATFAPDAPERCSGLPILRYDAEELDHVLGDRFALVDVHREEHRTPAGTIQPFTWAALERR